MAKTEATDALTRSRKLRREGRFAEALRLLEGVPVTAASLEEQAQAHRGMGNPEAAVAAYRALLDLTPVHAEALYQLAAVLIELRRAAEAEEAAGRLQDLEPSKSRGPAIRGMALRAAGRLEEAVPFLERAIALAPADFTTMNGLMMVLYKLGRREDARVLGLKAMELKDSHARAAFAKSPQARLTLKRRLPPFDPTRPERNVIAFSLWGDHPDYTHGAILNAQTGPRIYEGWTCRFYCDDTVPGPILDELRRLKAQVIMMPDRNQAASGAFWRFFASDDPEVDRFLCRDADSRLTPREKAAVEDWLASDLPFHAMRDHIYHNELILAGLWGGVAGVLPNLESLARQTHLHTGVRHADQNFLRLVVWPLVRDEILIHDSQYRFAGSRDFPEGYELRPNLHVGWGERGMPPWKPR